MFIFRLPPAGSRPMIADIGEMFHIALRNPTYMRTLEENYALLERLVNDENIYLDPSFPFDRVCRLLGVKRRDMDALLRRELGVDGDALFKSLRAALPERLERKYGLKCFFQEL